MSDIDWQRLQSIFQQAVDLPSEEREAFLELVCEDNFQLKQELEALLAADQTADSLNSLIQVEPAGLDEDLIGTDIDEWRIIKSLGVGGMGTVFLAKRTQSDFQQLAALKLVKKGMDSFGVNTRFQLERQILARLNHKNIAKLIDGGVTQDGRPYFVMEYVDGSPIIEYCDNHRLGIKQRLELFRKVCDAVHYAHTNLIVHRDLKPSNIIVTESGELKLLDFGIAKLLDDDQEQLATRTGLQIHTPAYASPEQLLGDTITTASDVYALGILFYQLLTGRRPFEVRRTVKEFRELVLTQQPLKPSDAVTQLQRDPEHQLVIETLSQHRRVGIQRLKRSIAGDLDTICLMALHREPQRRYTSASEFSSDIKRHLRGQPVAARPDSTLYRLSKFVQRNRAAVMVASLAVLSIGLITLFYTDQLKQQRDIAVSERKKAEQVVQFVTGLFEHAKPSRSLGEEVSARELLDEGARAIDYELLEQPVVQQTLRRVLGEVYYKLGDEKTAKTLLSDALEQQVNLLGTHHLDVATTQLVLALLLQDQGNYDKAEQLLTQSLKTKREILGDAHFDVVEVLSVFAYFEQMRGNYAQAEKYFKQGLATSKQLSQGDNVYLAKLTKQLGGFYRYMDRKAEAESLLRQALAMQERIYNGGPHPDINSSKRELAALLRDEYKFQESKQLYLQVIESRTKILGPDHGELGNTWNSYSLLLSKMGEHEEALEANKKFLEILKRAYPEPTPSLAAAYNNHALTLKDLGRYEEAMQYFRLSTQTQDEIKLPENHIHRSYPFSGIARIYMLQEKYSEAVVLYRKILAVRRGAVNDEHKAVIDAKIKLGAALTQLSEFKEAEEWLLDSYQTAQSKRGSGDRRTQTAVRKLIALYQKMGDKEKQVQFEQLLESESESK